MKGQQKTKKNKRENEDNIDIYLFKHQITCPRSNSAITQPLDHISMAVVYSVAPNISSGAR